MDVKELRGQDAPALNDILMKWIMLRYRKQ
jgi:hypothetical protein